jgi:proteasome lid subunit RPN8/RPN11
MGINFLDINNKSNLVYISNSIVNSIFRLATEASPKEICGLLGEVSNKIEIYFPVSNISSTNTKFEMDPLELLNTHYSIDSSKYSLGGIYHSHPSGPNKLSPTDIQETTIFSIPHFVISLNNRNFNLSSFVISENRDVSELIIQTF